MTNTIIRFDFPAYKLQAIEQALREKQEPKAVPELLLEYVDGFYQRNVPAPARKYLDAMLGEAGQEATPEQAAPQREQAAAQREQATSGQKPEPSARRQPRGHGHGEQRQEATLTPAPGQAGPGETAPEPELAQEMALGM